MSIVIYAQICFLLFFSSHVKFSLCEVPQLYIICTPTVKITWEMLYKGADIFA